MHVKYANLHSLYSVPNVFVTDDGAIVVARALRVVCVGFATDWRGVALRTTVLFVPLRAVVVGIFVVVLALRDVLLTVDALRAVAV